MAENISNRDKLILTGLYLSKFDIAGLKALGFDGFTEAFNVIGLALGAKPASIKNYRDEFDPLFPNPRQGWHGRPTRDYCLSVYEQFSSLGFPSFTGLIQSFFGWDDNAESSLLDIDANDANNGSFAQRLMTGVAAESYFESVYADLPEFRGLSMEKTTAWGCGYDFQFRSPNPESMLLAVEVKGLRGKNGSILMTPKEYGMASALRERFFLFVVRNFKEVPTHDIFQNPLATELKFNKVERIIVQTSWAAYL